MGPRGLGLLGVAGVAGIVLAVHGYGHGGLVAGASGTLAAPGGRTSPTTAAPPANHSTPHTAPGGTAPSTTTTAPSSKQKLGPALSSTPYAAYAYALYPGPQSSQAKAATAGFDVTVTPGNGTFTVAVSVVGTSRPAQTTTYPSTDKVYFVESSLGDDSNDADYSFGDDGIVVTDAQGRIVQ